MTAATAHPPQSATVKRLAVYVYLPGGALVKTEAVARLVARK